MKCSIPSGLMLWVLLGLFAYGSVHAAPPINLGIGIHRIETEVASTFDERAVGLMHRNAMPAQNGMLFVFPEAGEHCMWMRDTLIPLSVAFLDANGTIFNIEDMAPQTLTSHCAVKKAKFALEMNRGWFKQRGIAPGATITGIEKAPLSR